MPTCQGRDEGKFDNQAFTFVNNWWANRVQRRDGYFLKPQFMFLHIFCSAYKTSRSRWRKVW